MNESLEKISNLNNKDKDLLRLKINEWTHGDAITKPKKIDSKTNFLVLNSNTLIFKINMLVLLKIVSNDFINIFLYNIKHIIYC